MNKKTLTVGFLSAVVAGSVLLTSSVAAFWPFDSLFSKGQVKAVTTDANSSAVRATRASYLYRTLTQMNMECNSLYGIAGPLSGQTQGGSGEKGTEGGQGILKTTLPNGTTISLPIARLDSPVMNRPTEVSGVPYGVVDPNLSVTGSWKEDKTSIREIALIDSSLKSRCAEITKLYTRLTKIYSKKVETPPARPKVTPTTRPGIIQNIKNSKTLPNGNTIQYQ